MVLYISCFLSFNINKNFSFILGRKIIMLVTDCLLDYYKGLKIFSILYFVSIRPTYLVSNNMMV